MDHLRDRAGTPGEVIPCHWPDAAESTVLLFQLGINRFALNIDTVVQVIPMLKLAPLPQKHPLIEGFANIRGQLIPVIFMRQILGMPALEPQLNTPILLTLINGRMIGLIMDEVNDVVVLPADQIARPDALIPDSMEGMAVLIGVAYMNGHPVFLIDADHLLNPAQVHVLNRVIEALDEQIDSQGKPRKRRKNLSAALADQVATIALDLPPLDGVSSPSSKTQPPDIEP